VIGILSQWKAVVYGLLFVAVLGVGWWLAARITRSYEADYLEKRVKLQQEMIIAERKSRAKAEHDAQVVAVQLSQAQAEFSEHIKSAIKRVKVIIPEKPDCDFPDGIVGVLNAARRGTVPDTTVVTTPVAPPVPSPP